MLGAMSQEAAGGGVGARGRDDGEARVCEGVRGVARWCVPVASTTLPFQTVWILWIGLNFVWSVCVWFGCESELAECVDE